MTPRARNVAVAASALAIAGALFGLARKPTRTPEPTRSAGSPDARADAPEAEYADFVGADACASCHRAAFDRWRASTHGRAGGAPDAVRIIAQFDGKPRRFRDATVTPVQEGASYKFIVRVDGQPEQVFGVDGVVGGGHMFGGGTQAFFTKSGDGTMRFLPFDFIRDEAVWFCNAHSEGREGLAPISEALSITACADWPPARVLGESSAHDNCQSCHGSQVRLVRDADGGPSRTDIRSLSIDCEACHGPGRRHIERANDPAAVARGDLGMTPLATLDKRASVGVCAACHSLKTSLRPGYVSGRSLEAYYATLLPQLGDDALHPDGRTKTFAYQEGHLFSDCYVNGGMVCTSCHDPHSQGYRDHTGAPLEGRFDDGQCTSCHASKRERPEAHTHHAARSRGSRCVACHMPYLRQPSFGTKLLYARSDHTISIPRPLLDKTLGVDGACVGCHSGMSTERLSATLRTWFGEGKPIAPAVDAALRVGGIPDMREAARLVLRPDERSAAALFAGMSRFGEKFIVQSGAPIDDETSGRLEALTRHADIDVRALAAALADMGAGTEARSSARLAELRKGDPLVRARWVSILLYYAEEARAHDRFTRAIALLDKALALDPARPDALTSLGFALAASGRLADAATRLHASLAIDARQPRALLYLGEVMRDTHQPALAVEAWHKAVAMDHGLAAAHLHLAEEAFEAGKDDEALASVERALQADPRLAPAQFVRARVYARKGDSARAAQALGAGLAIDDESDEARETRAELAAAGISPAP